MQKLQLNLFNKYWPIGAIVRETTFYRRPGIVAWYCPDGYHYCFPIPLLGGDFLSLSDELEFIAMFRPITGKDQYIACTDELYRFTVAHGIRLEDYYLKFSTYCGDQNPAYQNWLDEEFNSKRA